MKYILYFTVRKAWLGCFMGAFLCACSSNTVQQNSTKPSLEQRRHANESETPKNFDGHQYALFNIMVADCLIKDNVKGVFLIKLAKNSVLAKYMRVGDQILKFWQDELITSSSQLTSTIQKISPDTVVSIEFLRGKNRHRISVLPPAWKPTGKSKINKLGCEVIGLEK